MNFLFIPLGWILRQFSNFVGGNFAFAVFLFTFLVNAVMFPLTIKTQKSSLQQIKLRPKLDLLKKKYGDDKAKYNSAMQELYQRENVSMAGGCLPMIIRLVFMLGVYWTVMSPLTYILNIPKDEILRATEQYFQALNQKPNYELQIIPYIQQNMLNSVDFSFFGLDLTETPKFSWNIFGDFQLIWFIPLLAFATSMLSSIFSIFMQKATNPGAQNMAGMMLIMPLFSLYIAFKVPGAVGFYWACSNLVAGILQLIVQTLYNPNKLIADEQSAAIISRHMYETKKIKEE